MELPSLKRQASDKAWEKALDQKATYDSMYWLKDLSADERKRVEENMDIDDLKNKIKQNILDTEKERRKIMNDNIKNFRTVNKGKKMKKTRKKTIEDMKGKIHYPKKKGGGRRRTRRKQKRRRKGGMLKRVADAMKSFPIARPPSSIPLNREQQLKKTIDQLSMQQMEGQNFINDEEKKLKDYEREGDKLHDRINPHKKKTWTGSKNDPMIKEIKKLWVIDQNIKRIKGNIRAFKDFQMQLDMEMKSVKQSLSDIHHESDGKRAKKPAAKKGSIQSTEEPEGNKYIGEKYLGGKRRKSRRKRRKSRRKRRKSRR